MSTDTHAESRHESPADATVDADGRSSETDDDRAPTRSFDAAATFDPTHTRRLPNTVDAHNKYVG